MNIDEAKANVAKYRGCGQWLCSVCEIKDREAAEAKGGQRDN